MLQYGSNKSPISFEVQRGTTTWLRGENGVGKTTLLLTILGFYSARSGKIEWTEGVDCFAYVSQKPTFEFGLTTRRVLDLAKVDINHSLIKGLQIQPLLDKRITSLSGGEKQRVQIGIALCQNASHILLDEPFASQDLESIELIKAAIASEQGLGKAFIVASHVKFHANQIISLV